MSEDSMKAEVLKSLGRIAPEADLDSLLPGVEFRDQLDIDSFDFLNFIIALHESTGIDVPEAEYGKLASLEAAVKYLLQQADTA